MNNKFLYFNNAIIENIFELHSVLIFIYNARIFMLYLLLKDLTI